MLEDLLEARIEEAAAAVDRAAASGDHTDGFDEALEDYQLACQAALAYAADHDDDYESD